jgi:hypothetical protein
MTLRRSESLAHIATGKSNIWISRNWGHGRELTRQIRATLEEDPSQRDVLGHVIGALTKLLPDIMERTNGLSAANCEVPSGALAQLTGATPGMCNLSRASVDRARHRLDFKFIRPVVSFPLAPEQIANRSRFAKSARCKTGIGVFDHGGPEHDGGGNRELSSHWPDVNPIANVWTIRKRRLEGLQRNTRRRVINVLIEVWNTLDMVLINALVDSMGPRLAFVVARPGGRISKGINQSKQTEQFDMICENDTNESLRACDLVERARRSRIFCEQSKRGDAGK